MKRHIERVTVETYSTPDGDRIRIQQSSDDPDAPAYVEITVDQIDLLIAWLQEARQEIDQRPAKPAKKP